MIIQSPGEKIKNFRRRYKIRQHEICGDIITRNMLSMIENNKTPLSTQTAKKLMLNIEELCVLHSIECTLTLDDLLSTPEMQITQLTESIIDSIDRNLIINPIENTTIHELFILIDKHALTFENVLLNYSIANYFFRMNDFQNAYKFYTKILAYASLLKNHNLEYLYLSYECILSCCIKLEIYHEAINIYKLVQHNLPDYPVSCAYSITLNMIISHTKLNLYQEALDRIKLLEHNFCAFLVYNQNHKHQLMRVKGDIYKNLFAYDLALALYKDLLSCCEDDLHMHLTVLLDLCDLLRLVDDSNQLNHYTHELENLINFNKDSYFIDKNISLYLTVAQNLCYLGAYAKSEHYYMKALPLIYSDRNLNDLTVLMKGLHELMLYSKNQDLIETILSVFKDKMFCLSLSKTFIPFNLMNLFLDSMNIEAIRSLNESILLHSSDSLKI